MLKKTRRILFYVSAIFFSMISAGVLLFAFGYKYDFVQNKFLKTGSLEIRPNVAAEIYINDELTDRTSFLSGSFSKNRLLPRTYNLRVEKEKYQSWQKLVKIEAGFFSSFPRVVLLPVTFEESVVASSSVQTVSIAFFDPKSNSAYVGNKQTLEKVDLKSGAKEKIKTANLPVIEQKVQPATSPDGVKIVLFNDHELFVSWLKDSNYQPYNKTGDKEFLTRFSQKIDDVLWYKDSAHLIVSVGGLLKFVEIDTRGGLNIFDIATVIGQFYYDRDSNAIFKFDGNKLIKIDLK